MLVGDIMSKCEAECTEDMPLQNVYELIQNCGQGFAVVVDSEVHRVQIGLVTEHSICKQVVGRGRNVKELAAGNVLDSRVPRIEVDAPVTDCGPLFADGRNKVVLVVNRKREFLGLVFRDAFVRAQEPVPQVHSSALHDAAQHMPNLGWAH